MKNSLLVILITFFTIACKHKSEIVNKRLELAKWSMYSLNYNDTFVENNKKLLPIECNLKLVMSHESKDRAIYCFDFYFNDTSNRCYLNSGIDCIIVEYDTLVDIVKHHVIVKKRTLKELTKLNQEYIKPNELSFREYLKFNKFKANKWLKNYIDK